jgi:catechol-2,3-dioxygenase
MLRSSWQQSDDLKFARVILFTPNIDAMSNFYGEVIGLHQITNEKGWREFAAGGARTALHSGPSSPGRKGPKIVFYAKDVAALREKLVARSARLARLDREKFSVSAMAKTRTAIPFNCPTADLQISTLPSASYSQPPPSV